MFDFSKVVDHYGAWCTQWDYVADRFGTANLLSFTISGTDFITAPCITEALGRRLVHGVFGYSRWKNDELLAATAHWPSTQYYTAVDPQSVVYNPSIIYMVSEPIRQWSETGKGMVIHTPVRDAFYKAIGGNQRTVMSVVLEKQPNGRFYDMGKLEAVLVESECKIMLLCSSQNPIGRAWTYDELGVMVDLCERHGVRVVLSEIHMDTAWGEQPHIPWSNVARGDWALLTSESRSFNIPALTGVYGIIENSSSRDAYLSAPKGRDGFSFPLVLTLTAHIATYQQSVSRLDVLRVYLKDNLTHITDKMNTVFPELSWQIPQSAYLVWLNLRPPNIDDNALQKALIKQEKIAIVPRYTYGEEGRGFVRSNAGCPRSRLEKGVAGLINAIRAIG